MDPFDEANKLSAGARPRFLDPQCQFRRQLPQWRYLRRSRTSPKFLKWLSCRCSSIRGLSKVDATGCPERETLEISRGRTTVRDFRGRQHQLDIAERSASPNRWSIMMVTASTETACGQHRQAAGSPSGLIYHKGTPPPEWGRSERPQLWEGEFRTCPPPTWWCFCRTYSRARSSGNPCSCSWSATTCCPSSWCE